MLNEGASDNVPSVVLNSKLIRSSSTLMIETSVGLFEVCILLIVE